MYVRMARSDLETGSQTVEKATTPRIDTKIG